MRNLVATLERTDYGQTRDYATMARLRHALRLLTTRIEKQAEQLGVTPLQLQALLAIRGNDKDAGLTITELSEEFLCDLASMSQLVARMQKAKLVRLQRSKSDKRKVFISITPLGQSKLDTALTNSGRLLAGVASEFGGLSVEDMVNRILGIVGGAKGNLDQ